jgi:polyhydroxyalkanoate synthase subunit PhaC
MSKTPDSGKAEDDEPSTVEQYLVKDPERFALNMARMIEQAGKAASAWAEPREKGDVRDHVAEPVVDMVKTFSKLSEYWLSDPQRALEAQTRLFSGYMTVWANAIQRTSNAAEATEDAVKPERGDKRFLDPEWGRNAFFDFLKQAYLVTSRWAADLVEHAEGLDEHTRHKAGFYVKQVSNAISPSNFILTNPELFRETVASNGENLVRGMKMLAEDIAAGKGDLKVRQADYSPFEIGKNVAMSPGKVVGRSDVAEIIQYDPTTETVLKRPLLICPPWINKFYVLDLTPEKSFIKWCVDQGLTVFVISWVNPDERLRDKDFEDYMRQGPLAALDAIEQATGEKKVHTIGYCVGGTLLSITLAYMAAKNDHRVASATLFAAQVDFTHAGDLKVFVDEEQLGVLEKRMAERGYLEGSKMANAFNMLRSNDLIWPYIINNYLRGKAPMPFDLLYWNSDATRMPAANHAFYLRQCYLNNTLSSGKMTIANVHLDLKKVTVPLYNLATREDHIAPAKSAFLGSKFFGGPVKYVLSGSGHIAGVVNPPSKGKYQYWTGGKAGAGSLEAWLKKAKEHPGSWWPDWIEWIKSHGDEQVPPREPGGGKLTPIEDAPGRYVKVPS